MARKFAYYNMKTHQMVDAVAPSTYSIIPDRLLNPYTLKGNLGDIRYGYDDGAVVPSEYERIEYIQSSGSQHIDIGFAFNNKTKVEVVWASTGTPTTTPAGFIGSRGSSANNLHVAINYGSNGDIASDFNNSSYSTYRATYTTTLEKKYRVVTSPELRAIYDADTGEVKASNTTLNTETFTCDKNAYLFKSNGAAGYCLGRMYSAKIWNDGALQRNFIPVKKVSNNEYGMYDTVSKQFFGNSGSGTFTGGNVISRTIWTNGQHKVKVIGKNLFNKDSSEIQMGLIDKNGNIDSSFVSWRVSDYIPVLPNTDYAYTTASYGSANTVCSAFYNANKELLSTKTLQELSYHTPANCAYVRVSVMNNNMSTSQFEQGTVATDYEAYKEDKVEITDILPSFTSYIDKQTGALYKDWEVIWYDGSQDIPQKYISQTGDLTPNQIVAYRLIEPVYKVLPTTPISLNTKGTKTITVEAEVPCYIKAEYLSKDTIAFINSGVEHDIDLVGSINVTKTNNILEVM